MSSNRQALLNLRGAVVRPLDVNGNIREGSINTVIWTDTVTGVVTLGSGDKIDLDTLVTWYDVPETVFEGV